MFCIIITFSLSSTVFWLLMLFNIHSLILDMFYLVQKPFEDLSLEEPVMQECLFYLHNYGTHVAIVTFYRQHKLLPKAVHYILNQASYFKF